MSTFQVFKDNGQILFDTNLICYGLVKSGNMTWLQSWSRRTLRSAQLDPSDGSNYFPAAAYAPGTEPAGSRCDQIYGFTLTNAVSPIVFITGSGTLAGSSVTGSSITFYYANASTSTKFYCFDLMGDNLAGTTFLKTYDVDGKITFNSLQVPLNIIGASTPPYPPAASAPNGRKFFTYDGGRLAVREYLVAPGAYGPKSDCFFDVTLSAGVEYAAFLPWSRSANLISTNDTPTGGSVQYNVSEGAFGRVGGISFMFGAAAGTNWAYPGGTNYIPGTYSSIPVDRFPTALIITTANLPFPFN